MKKVFSLIALILLLLLVTQATYRFDTAFMS